MGGKRIVSNIHTEATDLRPGMRQGHISQCDDKEGIWHYKCDITNIGFENNYFDFIMCNHVLEHVVDDSKAMSELYRVLKPGGTALLTVPLAKELYEDYSIVKPERRVEHFGQWDHVRKYNLESFVKRLEMAGFSVTVAYPEKLPEGFLESTRVSTDLVSRKVVFAKK